MISISIIIPVYNLETYLERNYLSIQNQRYDNLQVIYIDDGSTDHSFQILSKIGEDNPNIEIYRQENRGQAAARNVALLHAIGDVVVYLDGDDFLADGALFRISDIMSNYDVDLLQYEIEDSSKYVKNEIHNPSSDIITISGKEWLLNGKINYACCAYAYRRDFIEQSHLQFVEGIYHEDTEIVIRALFFAKNFCRITDALYEREIRLESTTRRYNPKRCKDLIYIAELTNDFMSNHQMDHCIYSFFKEHINYLYSQGIHSSILQNIDFFSIVSEDEICRIVNSMRKSISARYRVLGLCLTKRIFCVYKILYLKRHKMLGREVQVQQHDNY